MNRNARFELRLTEAEKLRLTLLADAAKMDVSQYVRKRVLGSESVVPSAHTGHPAPPLSDEEAVARRAKQLQNQGMTSRVAVKEALQELG